MSYTETIKYNKVSTANVIENARGNPCFKLD